MTDNTIEQLKKEIIETEEILEREKEKTQQRLESNIGFEIAQAFENPTYKDYYIDALRNIARYEHEKNHPVVKTKTKWETIKENFKNIFLK